VAIGRPDEKLNYSGTKRKDCHPGKSHSSYVFKPIKHANISAVHIFARLNGNSKNGVEKRKNGTKGVKRA
jgi:hypothetical protein